LDPNNEKGHFRRGVALAELAMDKEGEEASSLYVQALTSYRTVLQINSKNQAAKTSLLLVEKKLATLRF